MTTYYPGSHEPKRMADLITTGQSLAPAPYVPTEADRKVVMLHPLRAKNDVLSRNFTAAEGGGQIMLSREAKILAHTGIAAVITYDHDPVEAISADSVGEVEAFLRDFRELSAFVWEAVHRFTTEDSRRDGGHTGFDLDDELDGEYVPRPGARPEDIALAQSL